MINCACVNYEIIYLYLHSTIIMYIPLGAQQERSESYIRISPRLAWLALWMRLRVKPIILLFMTLR